MVEWSSLPTDETYLETRDIPGTLSGWFAWKLLFYDHKVRCCGISGPCELHAGLLFQWIWAWSAACRIGWTATFFLTPRAVKLAYDTHTHTITTYSVQEEEREEKEEKKEKKIMELINKIRQQKPAVVYTKHVILVEPIWKPYNYSLLVDKLLRVEKQQDWGIGVGPTSLDTTRRIPYECTYLPLHPSCLYQLFSSSPAYCLTSLKKRQRERRIEYIK